MPSEQEDEVGLCGFTLKYVTNVGSKTTVDKYTILCNDMAMMESLKKTIEKSIEESKGNAERRVGMKPGRVRDWKVKQRLSTSDREGKSKKTVQEL